jgi:hypothetical protein
LRRRALRRAAAGLAGLLVATTLTSCSGGDSSYCSSLKDDQKQIARLSGDSAKPGRAGARALGATVEVLSGLADKAPEDVADEWDTLVAALRDLSRAIADSGASPSDFAGGKRPDGVTTGEYAAVRQAGEELRSLRVRQAAASIEQHAQDVCKVDLGDGLGGVG